MRKLLLSVAFFLVIFSATSCTVFTWQPVFNNSDGSLPLEKTMDVLSIGIKRSFEKETNIEEDWTKSNKEKILSSIDWEYEALWKALAQSSSAKTIVKGAQPERGQTFVRVILYKDYEASYAHKGWCEASWMTGSIIPCYGDLSVHHVEYVLYEDQVEQRKYIYTYSRKGAYWIGLLPFVWMNFFTSDQDDALVSTALQFLTDAKKDGFL